MSRSLQEQLLESGIAKPKQAKKARQDKARKNKKARREGRKPQDEQQLQHKLSVNEAAKREHDRRLNAERAAAQKARERDAAAAQLIEQHGIAPAADAADAVHYNYNHGKRIRRITVSDKQRRDLAAGKLGIVRHQGKSVLLPRATAERLLELVPKRIWLITPDDTPADPDDPYADYVVPDDLMW